MNIFEHYLHIIVTRKVIYNDIQNKYNFFKAFTQNIKYPFY